MIGLEYNSDEYESKNNLPKDTYSKQYGAFVVVCILSFLGCFYVTQMFIKSCENISKNQTSWEIAKSERITYLQYYPKGFMPFHQGILENVKQSFFHGNKLKEWILVDPNTCPKHMFGSSNESYFFCCYFC